MSGFCALGIAITGAPSLATEVVFENWQTRRDRGIVKQSLDYSCGLAALATLLTYHFDDPVSESQLLAELREHPVHSPEQRNWERHGVSLALLSDLARARGYRAVGVKVSLETLAALQVPVIAALEHDGMAHFTVLWQVDPDRGRYHLADPSWGNTAWLRHQLGRSWVDPATDQGKLLILDTIR